MLGIVRECDLGLGILELPIVELPDTDCGKIGSVIIEEQKAPVDGPRERQALAREVSCVPKHEDGGCEGEDGDRGVTRAVRDASRVRLRGLLGVLEHEIRLPAILHQIGHGGCDYSPACIGSSLPPVAGHLSCALSMA